MIYFIWLPICCFVRKRFLRLINKFNACKDLTGMASRQVCII